MKLLPFRRKREPAAPPPSEATTDRRAFLRRGAVAGATAAASTPFVAKAALAQEEQPPHDTDTTDVHGIPDTSKLAKTDERNVFTVRQIVATEDDPSFRSGSGAPLGPPPNAPVAEISGAGPLTGTYQYAYTEGDTNGETLLSPVTSIDTSGSAVLLTVPPNRPGTVGRRLFRTKANGSTFYELLDFQSGDGYFQTKFVDTISDDALGREAPTTDTTAHYDFEVTSTVKYFRQHPSKDDTPHDLTLINGDPSSPAGWCIDAYGSIVSRQRVTHNFISFHTGLQADHFHAAWNDDTYPNRMVTVFTVGSQGKLHIRNANEGIALHVNPRVPSTTLGTAPLFVEPAPGSTQPSAWIVGKSGNSSAHSLILEQSDPASSAHCLVLRNAGTGFLITDSAGKFRVMPNGTLNLGNTTTWSYIPYLHVNTQLRAPYVTGTPVLNTNGEIRVDNVGNLWLFSGGKRYKISGRPS